MECVLHIQVQQSQACFDTTATNSFGVIKEICNAYAVQHDVYTLVKVALGKLLWLNEVFRNIVAQLCEANLY